MPVPKSLPDMTLSNWLLIPVYLGKLEQRREQWGFAGGSPVSPFDSDGYRQSQLPPRLLWFD